MDEMENEDSKNNINQQVIIGNKRQGIFIKYFSIPLIALTVFVILIINDVVAPSEKLILNTVEIPDDLNKNGITKSYLSQSLFEKIKLINDSANIKIKQMFQLDTIETDINDNPIHAKILDVNNNLNDKNNIQFEVKEFQLSSKNIVRYLRNILGKQDTYVDIYIYKNNQSIQCKFYIDKNLIEINNSINNTSSNIENICFQIAHHICIKYDPIIAILNDYHFASDYEISYNWKETYLNFKEKERILMKLLESESSRNKKWSSILLASLYKDKGYVTRSENLLQKSIRYYKKADSIDTALSAYINREVEDINNFMNYYCDEDENDIMLYNILKKYRQQLNDSKQLIVAYVENGKINDGFAIVYEKTSSNWQKIKQEFEINIGTQGFAAIDKKREGDYKTPSGIFSITRTFGYNNDIETEIEFITLNDSHVWITDKNDIQYNKITTNVQYGIKHEKLRRSDHLNKYGIIIDYNMNPIVKGMGSAIFMHVQKQPGYATAGCISTFENNIIDIIQWLKPQSNPMIVMGEKYFLMGECN